MPGKVRRFTAPGSGSISQWTACGFALRNLSAKVAEARRAADYGEHGSEAWRGRMEHPDDSALRNLTNEELALRMVGRSVWV
jgi:hypothetical protein